MFFQKSDSETIQADYYVKAIQYLMGTLQPPIAVIMFSERFYKRVESVLMSRFVGSNILWQFYELSETWAMFVMSKCDGIVISSLASWWSAYISSHATVVTQRYGASPENMTLPGWQLL